MKQLLGPLLRTDREPPKKQVFLNTSYIETNCFCTKRLPLYSAAFVKDSDQIVS